MDTRTKDSELASGKEHGGLCTFLGGVTRVFTPNSPARSPLGWSAAPVTLRSHPQAHPGTWPSFILPRSQLCRKYSFRALRAPPPDTTSTAGSGTVPGSEEALHEYLLNEWGRGERLYSRHSTDHQSGSPGGRS